jgi:hypothetical protein
MFLIMSNICVIFWLGYSLDDLGSIPGRDSEGILSLRHYV